MKTIGKIAGCLMALALSLTATNTFAQGHVGTHHSNVSIDVLGPSGLTAINFDSRFKKDGALGYRIGVGFNYSTADIIMHDSNKTIGVMVPAGLNYLIGKNKSKLELGLGGTAGYYKIDYNTVLYNSTGAVSSTTPKETQIYGYLLYAQVGYRFISANGFQLRAGVMPTFNMGDDFAIDLPLKYYCPYLSIGWEF